MYAACIVRPAATPGSTGWTTPSPSLYLQSAPCSVLFRLLSFTQNMHSVIFIAGFGLLWILLWIWCPLITVDSRKKSTAPPSSSASKPPTSSATSSPAKDTAARSSCSKCSRRMSSYPNDKHLICLNCRDVNCSVDVRCKECRSWSTEAMLEYVKNQKSLVSNGRKCSSVATPASAPPSVSHSAAPVQDSACPSQVVPPVPLFPQLPVRRDWSPWYSQC